MSLCNNSLFKLNKKELVKLINTKDKEILELKIFESNLETKESYSVEEYINMYDEKSNEYLELQKKYDNLATQLNQTENKLKKKLNENNVLTKKLNDLTNVSQVETNKLMKQTKKQLVEEISKLRLLIN